MELTSKPISELQVLLQAQAEDWEEHKASRIAELREKQAGIITEYSDRPTELIPKLTAVETEIKTVNLGGAPTLQTVIKTSKLLVMYEDVLYELPAKTGSTRTTGKRVVPFKTGARVICTIDGTTSPVYRVLESGKVMDEETKEILSISNAVCVVKTGMSFEDYKALNPTFQGFAGWSINNYKAWTELSETE